MLKKNNVAADVVSMGETDQNQVRVNRVGLVFVFSPHLSAVCSRQVDLSLRFTSRIPLAPSSFPLFRRR